MTVANSKGVAQLSEAAAIAAELGCRHPELRDRFRSLAMHLNRLAESDLVGSPMALPLTAPIHRNAINLQEADGERFRKGIQSLEEQVANLQRRAGDRGRSPGI